MEDKKDPRFKKKVHPLGWGDRELLFLISTGMNDSNLYRAMGYKLPPRRGVPQSFKQRVAVLKDTGLQSA